MSNITRSRRIAWLLLFFCLVGLAPLSAVAEDPVAESFVFEGMMDQAGKLQVSQTITSTSWPDQVTQSLATKQPIDATRYYRYQLTDFSAKLDQAAASVKVSQQGDAVLLTVDTAGSKAKTLTISYQVVGTSRAELGSDRELTVISWPVLQGMSLGFKEVSGRLQAGATTELVDCTAGQPGAIDKCPLYAGGTYESPLPTFQAGARAPGDQVVFTVGLKTGVVPATAVIGEVWSLDRAFAVNPATIGAALAGLLLGGALLYWLFRRTGVDQIHDGKLKPIAGFTPTGPGESVFEVYDQIRPGHVGTVADERVDPVDVTATIIDLAVRGHLRITELPREPHALLDWSLTRTENPADELEPFETLILDAIAPVGEPSLVSALPANLAPKIAAIQDALYDEVVDRGWFESRPDSTRNSWRTRGFIGIGVAAVVAALLVIFTSFGLLALVLLLLAAGLLWISERMPRRTAAGAKLVSGLGALSALLATQPVDQLPKGREIAEISRVLPYAIVLGGKQRWVEAMVQADEDESAPDPTTIDWYHAPQTWHLQDLPTSLTQFIHTVQGELFAR